MYLDLIKKIDSKRESRFIEIKEVSNRASNRTSIGDYPEKGCSGMYFFYSSYEDKDFEDAGEVVGAAIPIAKLAKSHRDLPNICKTRIGEFRLVYNGIGGFNGSSYDLRVRILQEISSNHKKTGSLCIKQSNLNDLSKWRFSYVTMHSEKNSQESDLGSNFLYCEHARNLERCWRLVNGWPLLCRH